LRNDKAKKTLKGLNSEKEVEKAKHVHGEVTVNKSNNVYILTLRTKAASICYASKQELVPGQFSQN